MSLQNVVFVLDSAKCPLAPCRPARSRQQQHFGFRTGDLVVATVPHGKRTGRHEGRVLCRTSGSFDVQTANGRAADISHRHCHVIQQRDGYAYAQLPAFVPAARAGGFLRSNQ